MVTEDKIKAIDAKIREFEERHLPDLNLVYVIDATGTRYVYHSRRELRVKIATALESRDTTSLDTLIKKDVNNKLRVVAFEKVHHPTQNLYIPGNVREELLLNPPYKIDMTPVEGAMDADKIERYFEQKRWGREFGYLRKHAGDEVFRIVPSTVSFRIERGVKHADGKMAWKHHGGGYYKDFFINEKGVLTQRKKEGNPRARNGARNETTKVVDVVEFVDLAMKYRARVVKIHVWLKNVSNVILRKDTWEYVAWEPNKNNPPFVINIYERMADWGIDISKQKGNIFNFTAPSFSKIEATFDPALPSGITVMVLDPTRIPSNKKKNE